jgi:hypothetical protein
MRKVDNKNSTMAVWIALVLFVLSSSVFAQPPDNAALSYYQAFLLYEKPDETMSKMLTDFRDGKIGANEIIEQHIEKNRRVIDFIVTAADTAGCDWGYDYSQGFDMVMPNLAQLRQVAFLIDAEARLLSEQGDCKMALDRCLSMHKMALHAADRTIIGYLVAIAIGRRANTAIPAILKDTAPEPVTLKWLRNELFVLSSKQVSAQPALQMEQEVALASATLEGLEQIGRCLMLDPNEMERLRGLDEDLIQQNRDYYTNYMASAQAALSASEPYEQIYTKLKKLDDQLRGVAEEPGSAMAAALAPAVWKIYGQDIRAKTHSNAVRTALDIYIIKAETGRLPDALPAGLPKDLFSGKDFEYEKTEAGFVLRCQARDLLKDVVHEYEFKVSD